ncbi:MAG: prolyl oligopeptidase family serine peptidase [Limisphaerales bacterium]
MPWVVAALLAAGLAAHARLKYPETRKLDVVEDYHGVKVADPYRWLEDDNAPEVKAWVEAQNAVTSAFLEGIPERDALRRRLTTLWNYERYGIPAHRAGRYFYTRNDGLQNQSVLYVTESLEAAPRVLIDPNTLATDGTVSLTGTALTDDARLIAYGVARSGSDWQEWRVRDVATATDLPDVIKWVKFSGVSWLKDGGGFFYSRYAEPAPGEELKGVLRNQKLYFHKLGTDQSADRLVYERPDQPEWSFNGQVTDDGKYLIISVGHGTDPKNRLFYQELTRPDAPVIELLNDFDASYNFVDNDGPVFWFHTDLDAPRGRVIAIDTRTPARTEWKELIPEAKETLQGAGTLNQMFVASYLKDAQSQFKFFTLDGKFVREVELPGIGTAGGFAGRRDERETFYLFTSFTVPGRVFRYDAGTGQSTLWRQPRLEFSPDDFETKQVFYTSKDGTRVPMFITHRKGLKLNGRNPTLLYGYGGFNISLTPAFSVTWLAWMELGGVFAQPSLRGGGEYGETWHKAGTKLQKQNVFDDFIAAAEWLIENDYTRPSKLAIAGGSNGGLLVGAAMTQRPDLFGAALPAVGVMDMLRFHKFTIGWAWTSDYGSSDNAGEFPALYAYSPYHNLKPGARYPATMVTTADHDDRVVPAHSFKFAARLHEMHRGSDPVLIRIDTKAGHGAGKPTAKLIEEAADRLAFLVRALKAKVPE